MIAKPTTTWILIARRSSAVIFSSHGPGLPMSVVSEIGNPRGRWKNRDIDADRPGRTFDRRGFGRHAVSTEESPTERIEHEFAARLAEQLDHDRALNAFDRLVLVAPPKLLGVLRDELPNPTRQLVVGELAKDLVDPTPTEVREHLAGVVLV
jgi:protein required for attachment to host cells